MEARLPDWMFASFAIAGWELFDFLARTLHEPRFRYAGGGVVACCALVLACRYLIRFIRRRRNPQTEDPDEWKRY